MEIAQRFPRAVDDGGKLDVELELAVTRDESFPPASTARHFHGAPRFHAVFLSCWKPRNSFRLAACISWAAAVSLCELAIRSKAGMLRAGFR